jgi:ribonuclease PH
MSGDGRFVEVQVTAERDPFDRAALDRLLDLAVTGVQQLLRRQLEALAEVDVS